MEDHNRKKIGKVLIVLDDMVTDTELIKKISPIVTELFLRGRELNISLVFISQSYVKVSKTIRLNAILFYHENT